LPSPTRKAYPMAILLHDHCGVYAPPPTSPLYAIHHTILAMSISWKGQAPVQCGAYADSRDSSAAILLVFMHRTTILYTGLHAQGTSAQTAGADLLPLLVFRNRTTTLHKLFRSRKTPRPCSVCGSPRRAPTDRGGALWPLA